MLFAVAVLFGIPAIFFALTDPAGVMSPFFPMLGQSIGPLNIEIVGMLYLQSHVLPTRSPNQVIDFPPYSLKRAFPEPNEKSNTSSLKLHGLDDRGGRVGTAQRELINDQI